MTSFTPIKASVDLVSCITNEISGHPKTLESKSSCSVHANKNQNPSLELASAEVSSVDALAKRKSGKRWLGNLLLNNDDEASSAVLPGLVARPAPAPTR